MPSPNRSPRNLRSDEFKQRVRGMIEDTARASTAKEDA